MKVFYVRAEPVDGDGPPAAAVVVARDAQEALVLLRKDIDFSGYRMPPAELTLYETAPDEVRRLLGDVAAHEIGVYLFTLLEPADPESTRTPPAAAR